METLVTTKFHPKQIRSEFSHYCKAYGNSLDKLAKKKSQMDLWFKNFCMGETSIIFVIYFFGYSYFNLHF